MITISSKSPASSLEINNFLVLIQFDLPSGFIDFYKSSNGAIINGSEDYVEIWNLSDIPKFNKGYCVEEFAPEFYIFGSNGGGSAYAIEKNTSFIYQFEFIGMPELAILKGKTFKEFLNSLK